MLKQKTFLFLIQKWCSTKVDNEGNHIPGHAQMCPENCPLKDDSWVVDDTITIHHHYDH